MSEWSRRAFETVITETPKSRAISFNRTAIDEFTTSGPERKISRRGWWPVSDNACRELSDFRFAISRCGCFHPEGHNRPPNCNTQLEVARIPTHKPGNR